MVKEVGLSTSSVQGMTIFDHAVSFRFIKDDNCS